MTHRVLDFKAAQCVISDAPRVKVKENQLARGDPQLRIRVPADVKRYVEQQALENASSYSSEVVRAIRAAMKTKGPASAETLPSHGSNDPR